MDATPLNYLAPMSGLADELLADLDGLSDNGSADYEENDDAPSQTTSSAPNGLKRKADGDIDMSEDGEEAEEEENAVGEGSLVLEGGVKPAEELDAEDVQQMDLGAIEDITSIAKLHGSKKMSDILKVNPSLHSLVPPLRLYYVGNWEISSKSQLGRYNVASCALEPGVHSHRASKQLIRRCRQ